MSPLPLLLLLLLILPLFIQLCYHSCVVCCFTARSTFSCIQSILMKLASRCHDCDDYLDTINMPKLRGTFSEAHTAKVPFTHTNNRTLSYHSQVTNSISLTDWSLSVS